MLDEEIQVDNLRSKQQCIIVEGGLSTVNIYGVVQSGVGMGKMPSNKYLSLAKITLLRILFTAPQILTMHCSGISTRRRFHLTDLLPF